MKTLPKEKWIYMPHPGHFIEASNCRFILNTYVGKYIVSTVGEYVSPLSDKEFAQIGFNRLYETMVFTAQKTKTKCCPYMVKDYTELEMIGYNDAGEAYKGHLKACKKWSKL